MTSVQDLRERLKKPLLLELRSGCQDGVVVGGIEKLVETVGKPFGDVRALIKGYADLEPEVRQEKLEQALTLLGPEEVAPVRSKNPSAAPLEPEPAPRETSDLNVLDHNLSDKTIDLGAQAPKKLAPIGVHSYRDLVYTYPKRYEDRRALPHFGALGDQEKRDAGRHGRRAQGGQVQTRHERDARGVGRPARRSGDGGVVQPTVA